MCQALFQCFLNTVSQNHQVQSYLLQEHRKKWALKWMRSNRNTLLCHGPHCLFEKGNAIKGDVWNEMVSVLISAVAAPSKVTNAYRRIHKHLNNGIEQCMDISPCNILQPSPSPYSIR